MIIHNVEQGSDEWHEVRKGVITGSDFSKILTAKTMKISSQADELENRIIAEILTGEESSGFKGNEYTERGHELEPDAASMYEMLTGNTVEIVGFVTNDEGTIGCSPDRLVGEYGLLEIKCPAAHTHIKSLLENSVGDEHKPQIQGQLLITGRKWCDAFSYHPTLPPSIVRVERDEEYIAKLSEALDFVQANIKAKIQSIRSA